MPVACNYIGVWLFLDETLVKKKPSENQDNVPSDTMHISDNSHSNGDSEIALQTWNENDASSTDIVEIHHEEEDNEQDNFESATDSEYDATSDTELIRSRRNQNQSSLSKKLHDSFKKCLQTFSCVKLARKVVQRLTDCVGGFFTCVVCLWSYDYHSKCRPRRLRSESSSWGKAALNGLWKTFKLILDRKVFLSVLLYGVIAFLAISANEV